MVSDTQLFDDTTIRDLLELHDEHGVLSFYTGHTPEQAADRQPTAPIEIRNGIRSLLERLEANDGSLARAVSDRIRRLDGPIDQLLDPKAHGRGRALFVGVSSGRVEQLSLQIPFRDRVVHHDAPFIRPLVAALDEGRAAGVLVASRSGTRLLRWSAGEIEELEADGFELTDAQLADLDERPAPANARRAQPGSDARERLEHRLDENLHRFLRGVVERTAARASDEGWDRIVVSGPPKLRDEVRELVTRQLASGNGVGRHVLLADQAFEDAPPATIAHQVWPLLRSVHQERERALVDGALERALAGGAGALGMRHVCEALNEGRVAHLLHDVELTHEGFVSEEGTLHPRVEGVVAASDLSLTREPLFVERMVEKAITTGAAVTPLGADAAASVADHEGVAALLRW